MIKKLILKSIQFYQKFISPQLGRHCRFFPSCSEYSLRAIRKYGVIKGGLLSFWRLLRCNPFCKGGVDIP